MKKITKKRVAPKKLTSRLLTTEPDHSLKVGDAVLIRTVTFFYTGRIKAVTHSDVVLVEAAWIAHTGRYATALKTGALTSVEPIPDWVIVGRGAIVDVAPWAHPLPREMK